MKIKSWGQLGIFMAMLIFALVSCRGGGEGLDDVAVEVAVTPDPPQLGPATVVVTLADATGAPVSGAAMSLEANMNHAGMVPVLADAQEVAPGRYEAALEFTMSGDWFILVQAKLPDGRSLEHQLDVPAVGDFCGTPEP